MTSEKLAKDGLARLLNERVVPYKQLSGFAKHHRIPTTCSDSDQRYLAELANDEIDGDLQEVFSALRKSFGLKRKEISVVGPSEGGGVITTPFFNYEIQVSLNPEDPAKVIWRRIISEISEPARVFAGPFEDVFEKQFSVLEILVAHPLDLEAIVDHIEDAELETVKIDYDKDLTWCEVQFTDSTTMVMIKPDSIRVVSRKEISPHELLESFLRIQKELLAMLNLTGIPSLTG